MIIKLSEEKSRESEREHEGVRMLKSRKKERKEDALD